MELRPTSSFVQHKLPGTLITDGSYQYLKYANPRESSSKISALASAQDPPVLLQPRERMDRGLHTHWLHAPTKAWLAGILRSRNQHAVDLYVTTKRISALKDESALPMPLPIPMLINIGLGRRCRSGELFIVLQVQQPPSSSSSSPVVGSSWSGPGLSRYLHPSITT